MATKRIGGRSPGLERMSALDWEGLSLSQLSEILGMHVRYVSRMRNRLRRERAEAEVKKRLDVERAKLQLSHALVDYGQVTGNAHTLDMSLRLSMIPAEDLVEYWHEPDLSAAQDQV